ncbi:LysR substrate-binding domain-containing protein [Sphingomonas sp. QA11]|uniref:LysR substrate-binding domain-containing protein n=1 Tax=Sphingomonas sp. QA11 TaxID=2950605 RepID=UPI00234B8835|nr:LysR substrate-binding domain-containing protein [Sphingomonas sp. QA11]WCM25012.1 LysR substrate-binding domain-containing protein [Sphingomonas sp. QA11]
MPENYSESEVRLSQIRNFVAVAERGSVQGAARQMGITQPAVTRSVRELEQELGATLFERTGSGMVLTKIGQTVLRRASGIKSEVERIGEEVAQLTGRRVGTVTVGLSFVAHAGLLPKVIDAFRRREPDVHVTIKESLFQNIEAEISNGTVDFYVGPIPPAYALHSKMLIEPLFENRRQIFCRRGHRLAGAKSLSELTEARWVSMSVAQNPMDDLAAQFSLHGLPAPQAVVRAETMLSMIFIAGSSDLLTALPQQLDRLIGIRSSLVRIPVAEQLASSRICIVKRASIPLAPAAEILSDLFRRAAIAHAATLPGTEALTR